MKEIKSDRQRRNFWMPSEIDMMLKFIEEVQRNHGSTSTTHSTFLQIANKMKNNGFTNKSAMQIRRKWFQMKSAYLCYKRGNYERLMLIPEEFRDKVAQFVEAERKYCHIKVEKELNNHVSKNLHTMKHELKNERSTPIPPMPKEAPNKTNLQTRATNGTIKDSEFNFEKQLEDFISGTKEMQKLLQNDFQRMQERLLTYQSKCQKMRAANVLKYFEESNFEANFNDVY